MSKAAKETQAVATTTDTSLTEQQNIGAQALALSKGPDEFGLSAADLRIATLLLMQPSSGMVSDQKAKLGDIINNESEQVIGSFDKALEAIALYKYETIRMYQASDGKFVKEVAYEGTKIVKEGYEDDVPVRRYHTLNFFVLLCDDIAKGEGFPVLIRFKSTSFMAGNKFASYLFKKKMFGNKLPYHQTGKLGSLRCQNEKKQNWAALTFSEGRETTEQERLVAQQMVAVINAKRYTVLEAEDTEASSSSASAAITPTVVGDGQSLGGSGPY